MSAKKLSAQEIADSVWPNALHYQTIWVSEERQKYYIHDMGLAKGDDKIEGLLKFDRPKAADMPKVEEEETLSTETDKVKEIISNVKPSSAADMPKVIEEINKAFKSKKAKADAIAIAKELLGIQ